MKPCLTPLELEILIHCHVSGTPHPRCDAQAVMDALLMFHREGIIKKNEELTSAYLRDNPGCRARLVYSTTPHGASLLESICEFGVTGSRRDGKCLTKGCSNHRHEGRFIGALCAPCYSLISEGNFNGGIGNTVFHDMWNRYREFLKLAEDRGKKEAELAAQGIELVDAYRTPDSVLHPKLEDAQDHQLASDFRDALEREGVGRGGSWSTEMIAATLLNLKQFKLTRR